MRNVTTTHLRFMSCNPRQEKLLSVNAGVPIKDALERAQCIQGMMRSALCQIGMDIGTPAPGIDPDLLFSLAYLCEISEAITESVVVALQSSAPAK